MIAFEIAHHPYVRQRIRDLFDAKSVTISTEPTARGRSIIDRSHELFVRTLATSLTLLFVLFSN